MIQRCVSRDIWMSLFILVTLSGIAYGDLNTNTAFMSSRRTAVSSLQVDEKIYIVGGYEMHDKIPSKKIEVFDTNTGGLIQTLELPKARGFVSPAHISPRLYFTAGRIPSNCAYLWDATNHSYATLATCGSTVRTPVQLSIHNSKLTVLGSFSADFYDISMATWTNSTKLTNHMQQLAGGITIIHEDLIISVGGFNITSNVPYYGAWIFNYTSNSLQLFDGATTYSASTVQTRYFRVATNTVVMWISDRCFVHRFGTADWIELAISNSTFEAVSLVDKTFVVDRSGYWQIDWQTNTTAWNQVDGLLSAFGVNDQFVILKAGETLVYFNGTWSNTSNQVGNQVNILTPFGNQYIIYDSQQWLHFYDSSTGIVTKIFPASGVVTILAVDDQTFVYFDNTNQMHISTVGGSGSTTTNTVTLEYTPSQSLIVIGRDIVDLGQGRVIINLSSNTQSINFLTNPLLSADGLAIMPIQSTDQEYSFIDVYNYQTGLWEDSLAPTFTFTTPSSSYRPVATLGNTLVFFDSPLRLYNTLTESWTNVSVSGNAGLFSSQFTTIPVVEGTAYFPLKSLITVLQTTSTAASVLTTNRQGITDAPDSFAVYDKVIYIVGKSTTAFKSIYTFNMTEKTGNSFFLPTSYTTRVTTALSYNVVFLFYGGQSSVPYIPIDNLSTWKYLPYSSNTTPAVTTTLANGQILTAGGEHYTLGFYSNEITWFNVSSFAPISTPSSSPAGTSLTGSDLTAAIVVPIVVGVAVAVGLTVFFVLRNKKKKKRPLNVVGLESQYGKWFIPFKDLTFGEQLGQGASGQVFKGTWKGTTVAMKVSATQANSTVIAELELMMQLRSHPNVVQLFGFSVHPETDSIILVIEYCSGGSLDVKLYDSHEKFLNEQKTAWIYGIAKGLSHLHSNNIVHRDIAARNILLQNNEPKITDFGMSRFVDEQKRGTTASELGPIRWMAPEALKIKEYSTKSDVWSFGIVVYEVVSQNEPHTSVDPIEVGRSIRDTGLTPTIPSDCPPKLASIMKECWKMSKTERPSMDQIIQELEPM